MNGTAKHNPKALDKTKFPKPRDRQLVKLRCPAKTCSDEQVVWLCSVCHGQLEHYEELIYCDCGRYGPSAVTFNCNKQAHGTGFVGFSSKHLLRHLGKLQQYRCLNILLLGETGVGKSTFINAFVNYLMFNTLDDAIQEEKLRWLIPFKFSYPDMSGPNRKPVHIEVCAGHNKNELDGSAGSSATQKTKVYRLKIGDTVIRLIDTPGIGDTRGFDQDKKNMANVLSTLGGLEELHGILFLLKPTMSRLTPAVRWCVKELLTHLHKDAARNLVFGFTNTRQAGYTPGDSYKPLESLLNEVDIALGGEIVYSFDSEGFRFLAALKQARNELDGIDAFRRSWERSKKEIHRLLHHFQMLQPHAIQSTISLNRARELITALTRPMADITGSIEDTIRINTERLSELQDSRCKGDELKAKLHFQRVIIHATKLARPRTVCCDQACVEYRDIGTGENRPVYKTLCHDPCYLSDVDADVVGHGNLTKCWAMNRTDWCRRCSHHWQQHLHFQWQQEEMVVEERDNNVARQIRDNESEIQVKETAIKSIKQKTDKAKAVRQEIRDAAVQFGLFLKHKSITPYNDETISYLDMLIKEEKQTAQYAKSVGLGGSKRQTDRLNSLIRSQNEYRERIAVFEQANETAKKQLLDERSVDGLIQRLYCLESWGPNLRVIMKLAKKATSSFSSEQEFNGPWRQSLTNDSNWVASQASEDESSSPDRPAGTGRAAGSQTASSSILQRRHAIMAKTATKQVVLLAIHVQVIARTALAAGMENAPFPTPGKGPSPVGMVPDVERRIASSSILQHLNAATERTATRMAAPSAIRVFVIARTLRNAEIKHVPLLIPGHDRNSVGMGPGVGKQTAALSILQQRTVAMAKTAISLVVLSAIHAPVTAAMDPAAGVKVVPLHISGQSQSCARVAFYVETRIAS
ncbi:G domain-containing protein [Fusarium keratoplasticum]|uniref:G domain-containing protein n=1 Tax=Fusarium keratoplasticum TaxID=1328300 RepID=A0ACC0QXT3_9HYPO|nr:G domain-containing protein [Fusarium keratoplasticum]KAI8670436.1 G domain-containing protein [Fusarium keratoplasticum]